MTEEQFLATIADLKQTFDSPVGKKVLYYLMNRAGFLRSSFVPGDSHGTAFNEGRRSVIVSLFEDLQLNIKDLEKELKELKKMGADNVTLD